MYAFAMKLAVDIGRTTFTRKTLCALVTAIFVASFAFAGEDSELLSNKEASSFDAPIKKTIIDFGPARQFENHPEYRATLVCYYYPRLMIKEYDDFSPGAVLSILSRQGKLPACNRVPQRGERAVRDGLGYLKGVKDALVFFDAGETFNGELGFDIYDSVSGKKIFGDSAYTSGNFRVVSAQDGYVLKYLRVVDADCNLHLKGRACWSRIKAQFGLTTDDIPVCTGYEHIAEVVGTDDVESRIAYPVEVTLAPRPIVKVLAGETKCWASQ